VASGRIQVKDGFFASACPSNDELGQRSIHAQSPTVAHADREPDIGIRTKRLVEILNLIKVELTADLHLSPLRSIVDLAMPPYRATTVVTQTGYGIREAHSGLYVMQQI